MKYFNLFNPFKISQSCRHKFCKNIVDSSAPTIDFFFMVVLSTLIVAFGLLTDNVILVIGGMLVAPLLSPILAISLGLVIKDRKVIARSMKIFFSSFAFVFIVAFFVSFFSETKISNLELIKIMKPSLFTLLVAMVAGVAASYTWVKPELDNNLTGTAVTVTLIPPLAAVGLSAASGEWGILHSVLSVFLLNVFGIIFSSLIIFSLMDFYKAKKRMAEEVREEERAIKKAKKEGLSQEIKK